MLLALIFYLWQSCRSACATPGHLLMMNHTTLSGKNALQVRCTGVTAAKGRLFVAVYDQESTFLDLDKIYVRKVAPVEHSGELVVRFEDLPAGDYAVACFHDLNNNNKLDKNLLGIPTEPYGFSNNARPKFRAPSWEEAKVIVGSGETLLNIRLEAW